VRTIRLKPASGADPPTDVRIEEAGKVSAGSFVVRVGEARHDVHLVPSAVGEGRLALNGQVTPFHAVRVGRALHVWLDGRTFVFELIERVAARSSTTAAVSHEEVAAPMPGTIVRICVKPGEKFDAHQPLIIMESMKMEMTLSVPHAGRVGEVQCAVGQLVPMGAVLATLEPKTDAV
jgi:acetyl/propionyl-CoA carboxylase alpha subunit